MKVLFLADANSVHTYRWVKSLYKRGVKVLLFSLSKAKINDYSFLGTDNLFENNFSDDLQNKFGIRLNKLAYLKVLPKLKKIIDKHSIDLIHAHYGTSYGFLATMSGFENRCISFWGTDVTEFPNVSPMHKLFFKNIIAKNRNLFATSNWLKEELSRYTNNIVKVIPFGVDTEVFRRYEEKEKNVIRFGIVKSLESQYNIEFAIKTFATVRKQFPDKHFEMLIAGEGTQRDILHKLCEELKIENIVKFVGRIPYDFLPKFYNKLDLFLNFSKLESFGVSVLEASACRVPVIAINIQGLKETIEDGRSGILIDNFDIELAASEIYRLISDENLRKKIGVRGRRFVKERYEWKNCVDSLLAEYKNIL